MKLIWGVSIKTTKSFQVTMRGLRQSSLLFQDTGLHNIDPSQQSLRKTVNFLLKYSLAL